MRSHVELLRGRVPEHIRQAVIAAVDQGAPINPGLGGKVEPVNVVVLVGIVEQAGPPEAVVPPHLALRLLAGGLTAAAAAVGEVTIAVGDGRLCRRGGYR